MPSASRYYHGVYPGGRTGEEDDITADDIAAYERAAGRSVAWVYFSNNWYRSRTFPEATASMIRARGAVPFIRLMLRSSPEQDVAERVFSLGSIAAGAFDADLRAWGEAARGFATPVIVEFGTEMNGEWFSWNARWNGRGAEGTRRFREALRHIVQTVRGAGAGNLIWVFHVNADDVPATIDNAFENYYPGDDVVDWVGFSAYGAQTPMDDEFPDFVSMADAAIPRLAALAPAKPIFAFEFGATSGNRRGDAAAWADRALGAILSDRWPALRGFSWWNETWQNDDNPHHDTDMRVQTVPGLAGVFARQLASPKVVDRPIFE